MQDFPVQMLGCVVGKDDDIVVRFALLLSKREKQRDVGQLLSIKFQG
jgi:hypothetical protein